SRSWYRGFLFDCRLGSDACRRADESQRNFSNRGHEHHGCGDCGSASYAKSEQYLFPVRDNLWNEHNIVLYWLWTVFDIARYELSLPAKSDVVWLNWLKVC